MIRKSEILEIAQDLGLRPDTVEKDYVLGWILFGIKRHFATQGWAFKGGTSLKKCFFETFRFSEDLDFTLTDSSQMKPEILLDIFKNIADIVYEETGIDFIKDRFKFKVIDKGNNKYFAQGKLQYNGPLRRKAGFASIKLDLTTDEIIVLDPALKEVHHPYSDFPEEGIYAICYAFEEVVAEKIRALAERARPRDVYDVVHFFRNRGLFKNPDLILSTLTEKCRYKNIDVPKFENIKNHEKIEELKPQWENMLAHQLPNLPSLQSFWDDLSPFFDWLHGSLEIQDLPPVSGKDEPVFSIGRYNGVDSKDILLHQIQFAAGNRVCVKLKYHEKFRIVEPLSFRTAKNGERFFYGWERDSSQMKSYAILKIQQVEITNITYREKFPVEISAMGSISMPPLRSK